MISMTMQKSYNYSIALASPSILPNCVTASKPQPYFYITITTQPAAQHA